MTWLKMDTEDRDQKMFRAFKRAITVSLAIHLVFGLAMLINSGCSSRKDYKIDGSVKVNFRPPRGPKGDGKPRATAPKPKPKPEVATPKPKPETPKPKPETTKPKPKPEAPKPTEKKPISSNKDPKPADKPPKTPPKETAKPESKPPEPAEPEIPPAPSIDQETWNNIMSASNDIHASDRPAPDGPTGTGMGVIDGSTDFEDALGWFDGDPRMQTYYNDVRVRLIDQWVLPKSVPAGQGLSVDVVVTVANDGTVLDYKIVKKSGHAELDRYVEELIQSAKKKEGPFFPPSPKPSPTGKSQLPLRFNPDAME